MLPLRSKSRPVTPGKSLTRAERNRVLEQLNAAVRCPDAHGGVATLPFLLDALAAGSTLPPGTRWIVDDYTRMSMAALVRDCFPQASIHAVAAEYGAAAHEQGWLRLDRTLGARAYAELIGTAEEWAESDRTLDEVVRAYGRPSVTFGAEDPRAAKTLGYGCTDRSAPLALFHFGGAQDGASARLLAFRCGDDLFGSNFALTPWGNRVADEKEKRRR